MTDERLFTGNVTDSGFFGTEGGDGAEALDSAVIELVDRLLEQAPPGREGLIHVLLGLQKAYDRVSWRVQELVADRFGMSPAQVAGVVSYYPALSAKRRGRLKVEICTGSACFLRGGEHAFEDVRRVTEGQAPNVDDEKLSVHQERCLGVCGLAPAVRVNARLREPLQGNAADELVALLFEADLPGRDEV